MILLAVKPINKIFAFFITTLGFSRRLSTRIWRLRQMFVVLLAAKPIIKSLIFNYKHRASKRSSREYISLSDVRGSLNCETRHKIYNFLNINIRLNKINKYIKLSLSDVWCSLGCETRNKIFNFLNINIRFSICLLSWIWHLRQMFDVLLAANTRNKKYLFFLISTLRFHKCLSLGIWYLRQMFDVSLVAKPMIKYLIFWISIYGSVYAYSWEYNVFVRCFFIRCLWFSCAKPI